MQTARYKLIRDMRRFLESIGDDAEAGQNGSAAYALDRLRVIRTTSDLALRRLNREGKG